MSFKIKKMSTEDIDFAVSLTDMANWNLGVGDFEFMMELEPDGCFILFCDGERAGLVTNINYGRIGWLGNLIVAKEYRGKEGGSLLVKHSTDFFKRNNVETVGLYAYLDKIPFYTRLGFKYDSDFVVLEGEGSKSKPEVDVEPIGKDDVEKTIDYDESCFGASRRKLLKPILLDPPNMGYKYIGNGQIQGYVVAKLFNGMAEVGPLMCGKAQDEIARALLRTLLARLKKQSVYVCAPKSEKLTAQLLVEEGFSEKLRVARMFFGPRMSSGCIYLAESLERG